MCITIITILILFFYLPIHTKINIVNNDYIVKLYIFSKVRVFRKTGKCNKYIEILKLKIINEILNKNENKLKKIDENKTKIKNKYIIRSFLQVLGIIKINKLKIENINIFKYINYDYLIGTYLITIINTCIYSYLAFKNINIKNIDIEKLFKIYNNNNDSNIKENNKEKFKFYCIISIKPVNIICIIFKIIIERGFEYVGTSYRKFNDYSNEISRKYD